MSPYLIPIGFGSLCALLVFLVFAYVRFVVILHKEGILPFEASGGNIFQAWKKLDAKYRTPLTFLGAFGLPSLLALIAVLLFIGWFSFAFIELSGIGHFPSW